MINISNWVSVGNIKSDRDALKGEIINGYLIDPNHNEKLIESIHFPPEDNQLGHYNWPKHFSDYINKNGNSLKAGVKPSDGELKTEYSQYLNNLWIPQNSNYIAFTTCISLDNWAKVGNIESKGDITENTEIKLTVSSPSGSIIYEQLSLIPNKEELRRYTWPYVIATFINKNSKFIKVGEKNNDDHLISPLHSSYRNILWAPKHSNLNINISLNFSEEAIEDTKNIYSKAKQSLLASPPTKDKVEDWHSKFKDGKFSDIQYPPPDINVDDVQPLYEHFTRIIAIENYIIQVEPNNIKYINMVVDGINHYASCKYQTSNWWEGQIGLARQAAISAMLIAPVSKKNALAAIFLPYIKNNSNTDQKKTGANRSDIAYVQIMWSLAGWKNTLSSEYIQYLMAASTTLSSLCMPVDRYGKEDGEGICVDYSFSQHNPKNGDKYCAQLYACSYGTVLFSSVFTAMKVLTGSFMLNHNAMDGMINALIQGLGWYAYANMVDFHPQGRAISRGNMTSYAWRNWVKEIKPHASDEQLEILNELYIRFANKDETKNNYFIGGKAHWVNDYLAYFAKGFCFWSKVVSTRTVGSESGNGENIKGYYIGCGSHFITTQGDEYLKIQPLWNWQQIPGTTTEQIPSFKWPNIDWGGNNWGSHDFAGVISDKKVGISSMILTREKVQNARKTTFGLPDRMICMGSCIDTSLSKNKVVTTVEQNFFDGKAIVSYLNKPDEIITDVCYITSESISGIKHRGMYYDFSAIPRQSITLNISLNTGSWSEINTKGSTKPVKGKVFTISINHKKSHLESYFYTVSIPSENSKSKYTISNNDNYHLVSENDGSAVYSTVYAVDEPIKFSLMNNIYICPLTATSFIARTDGKKVTITTADISQKGEKISFSITRGLDEPIILSRQQEVNSNDIGKSITLQLG